LSTLKFYFFSRKRSEAKTSKSAPRYRRLPFCI